MESESSYSLPSTVDWWRVWQTARGLSREKFVNPDCYDLEWVAYHRRHKVISRDDTPERVIASKHPSDSAFLPEIEKDIERILQISKSFSRKTPLLTEEGTSFVEHIRKQHDNVEPVWSSTRIKDPALLLLPPEERLYIDDSLSASNLFPPFTDIGYPKFKNNLFVTHAGWSFFAYDDSVFVNILDRLPSERLVTQFKARFEVSDWFNNYPDIGTTNAPFFTLQDPEVLGDNYGKFDINFMKVCRFLNNNVLCTCTTNGLVVIYDIKKIIKKFEYAYHRTPRGDNTIFTVMPLLVVKVPDSCWSVDIIDTEEVSYIAAGSNMHVLSIFAIPRDQDLTDHLESYSKDIPTLHNVPSCHFVPNSVDMNGFVTVAYTTIFGDTSTLKVKYFKNKKRLRVIGLDTQFFGENCWSVTPLKKNDFKSVNEFELLNANYCKVFKNSILYSVIQDSKLFELSPVSVSRSGDFGVGAISTQIPVPVSNLSLTFRKWEHKADIHLRFTAFDDEGKKINGFFNSSGHPLDFDISVTNSTTSRVYVGKSSPLQFYYLTSPNGNPERVKVPKKGYLLEYWKDLTNQPPSTPYNSQDQFHFSTPIEDTRLTHYNLGINGKRMVLPRKFICKESTYYPKSLITKGVVLIKSEYYANNETIDFSKKYSHMYAYDYDKGSFSEEESEEEEDPWDTDEPIVGPLSSQLDWALTNYEMKIGRLLYIMKSSSGNISSGYEVSDLDDDFLFVTTATKIYLVKANPLAITSFTKDDIFPIKDAVLCEEALANSMNRINIVCHIRELNCFVVASQLGLISILRLTEYNGIYSFRQEYIKGWESQAPGEPDNICAFASLNQYMYECFGDELRLPYLNIMGMDYMYIPENERNNTAPYAMLYVLAGPGNTLYRFKIASGKTPYLTKI
ncbi:hypothetical protein TBLA_0F00850 [Henningerozyma blattae CBS 6284]|uniref:Uncharacterized protein n=1 Tax=Henningerozyma blattae (strain ATCC 34711 / CBS 6284 / DSM 70876 / NBRC 10599 / NRRL Y-10934 / UCD 77-7) TaxID=1071380 RepID=I2H5H7_HENB6|nr:hypothetical protein TBLA_0F00850 [Tetrapisispora blattae CBS 6284]CCH61629.1 hypothetical protein TBLA_0F00850 [Tetrapisispora blattae CBS 6284]